MEYHKNIALVPFVFPSSLFNINTVCFHGVSSAFCLYFPFLREWSQPATTRSWILKSRRLLGSVSAKRKRSGEWLSPSLSSVQPKVPTRCPLIFHALSHLPRFIAVALTVGLSAALQSPTVSAGCLSFLLHNEFVYREGEITLNKLPVAFCYKHDWVQWVTSSLQVMYVITVLD